MSVRGWVQISVFKHQHSLSVHVSQEKDQCLNSLQILWIFILWFKVLPLLPRLFAYINRYCWQNFICCKRKWARRRSKAYLFKKQEESVYRVYYSTHSLLTKNLMAILQQYATMQQHPQDSESVGYLQHCISISFYTCVFIGLIFSFTLKIFFIRETNTFIQHLWSSIFCFNWAFCIAKKG